MFPPSRNCLAFLEKLPTSKPDKYKIIEKISHGGYGVINKAVIKNNEDAGFFALKTNRFADYQGAITTIDFNEIKSLTMLSNERNIVKFIELLKDKKEFTIVLEMCRVDLTKVIYKGIPLPLCDIKNMLQQIFTGIKAIHRVKIMHRDLKPANILLATDGTVKIADFGNAAQIDKPPYNCSICTTWYRCPELILGYVKYDQKIDIWSAGCLAVEFWMREPALFKGDDDVSQMALISQMCGFCSETIWPEAKETPKYKVLHKSFGNYAENRLQTYLAEQTRHAGATGFLGRLLKLNPAERMTASQALEDVFFASAPAASKDLNTLLSYLEHIGY